MTRPAVILLVEDDNDDADLCTRALQQSRIPSEVVRAQDGVEALELLGLRKGRAPLASAPHLILLDLNMPRMGGKEFLAAVRAAPTTRLLPVVVLTTSREERDVAEVYSSGANGYIVKPVGPAQFDATLRQLGLYWLGADRAQPSQGGAPP